MDRKQSAIIRIIAWSVVVVALSVMLVLGINGSLWNHGWFSIGFNSSVNYKYADRYQAGGAEFKGDEVSDLEVNWIDGSVQIEVYDGDTVQFSETSNRNLEEKEKLHYYNYKGRLIIQYQKAEKSFYSLGGSNLNKQLTIKIPATTAMGSVEVDTISSDSRIKGIAADKIEMDSTSGDCEVVSSYSKDFSFDSTSGSLTAKSLIVEGELDTDTTSGNVKVEGSVQEANLDTVSGSMYIDSDICPDKVVTDSTSGDVILTIPENNGFTYRKDSVSGSLECEFQVTQREDKGTYKNGGALFSFDSVSGDMTIRKR